MLGGPGDLGMFVASNGVSERPPIQLKSGVISVAFSSPYMISLNDQFLIIHG